jgi:adenylosuccinate synthase
MPTLVIVGAQWGDEAKGKIVDVLGHEADVVARYSGGNNAGHTVIIGDQTFKFHLLPAGILHRGTTSVLGGGMAICPKSLLDELARTREMQADLGTLKISPAAHVVFPHHRLLDQLEESARGDNKIGTTSRGIGPMYTDKVQRVGIRFGEFVRPEIFRDRFRTVLEFKNRLIELLGGEALDFESLYREYTAYAEQLLPYVGDTDTVLQEAVQNKQKVLFEGAQGTFLDLDQGTYPYVTSSHPISGGACLGTGIGPRDISSVLGVAKAYTTRVGEGPFPTELLNATGDQIREQGHEYGTTTGRPRRCGWMDAHALRASCRINSMSGLILTRVDVLSGIPQVSACVGYRLDGEVLPGLPYTVDDWSRIEPVYETFEGWEGNLRTARHWDDLPATAQRYLQFLEEFTKTPIAIISIGPDRNETIVRRPDLIWI